MQFTGFLRRRKQIVFALFLLLLVVVGFQIKNSFKYRKNSVRKNLRKSSYFETEEEFPIESNNDFYTKEKGCETIDIAIVCAGSTASQEVVTLLKSILFYRHLPLHVHFIVDIRAKKILSTLFRTWDISDFTVSFYSIEKLKQEVDWIPNTHYSGVFGLLKLLLLDVLPSDLERVIVLDVDLLFLDDIGNLYKLFFEFGTKQAVGLVDNQSDWYLGKLPIFNNQPWPAVGRGFNTGLMLLDCEKLREIKWNEIWRKVTKKQLLTYTGTSLADQDIMNAVIKENPKMVFKLPCLWNIQLSTFTQSETCYKKDTSAIKVLHWNSRMKQFSKTKHSELFRNLHYSFVVFDGAILRHPIGKCSDNVDDIEKPDFDVDFCQEMLYKSLQLRRTHLYYLPFEYDPSDGNDVTLTIHLSIDRLPMLDAICENWDGPISVAVFLSDADSVKLVRHIKSSTVLSERKNIGYHLIFQNFDDVSYPINFLRNVAWQQAVTEFVFLCDIDFLPSKKLYEYLKNSVLPTYPKTSKTAYIIPAFESLWYKFDFPATKSELLGQWDKGIVTSFRSYIWSIGHAATNYSKWRNSSEAYYVTRTKDYEPYVVLPKKLCPAYDKRFFGFGWNKVSHIMELDALGFNFSVLPFVFVIHTPHMASLDIMKYRSSSEYKKCIDTLKTEFISDLVDKYDIDRDEFT